MTAEQFLDLLRRHPSEYGDGYKSEPYVSTADDGKFVLIDGHFDVEAIVAALDEHYAASY